MSRRASIIHTPRSLSWRAFPHIISSEVFINFLEKMKNIISIQRDHRSPMCGIYIHADVVGQIFWTYDNRIALYKIFERMIPSVLELCLSFVKYRFAFVTDSDEARGNNVIVENITITQNHSITQYPEEPPTLV